VATLVEHKTAEKTEQKRVIYLTEGALRILREVGQPGHVSSDPVFRSRLGRAFTPAGLRSTFTRAAHEALGHHLGPYELRHTFAQMARRAVQPDQLQKLMGHTSITTTLLYYDVDPHAAAARDTLADFAPPRVPERKQKGKGKKKSTRPRPAGAGTGQRSTPAPGRATASRPSRRAKGA
jgi:integrase